MRTATMLAALALTACVSSPHPDPIESSESQVLVSNTIPRPLSAVAVTQCGLAVALYIQLDASHLLRADPRQSDLFTAVDGQQKQSQAGPMKWEDAYQLAGEAVLSSHVQLPCTDDPTT